MNKEEIVEELQEEDFVIRVRPFANDEGRWSGEVDISLMFQQSNPMDEEDFVNVMHFTKMMCASVAVMEEVEEFRNIVNEYVISVLDNELNISVELEDSYGVEKEYDGNVVHINFSTKTRGNA